MFIIDICFQDIELNANIRTDHAHVPLPVSTKCSYRVCSVSPFCRIMLLKDGFHQRGINEQSRKGATRGKKGGHGSTDKRRDHHRHDHGTA